MKMDFEIQYTGHVQILKGHATLEFFGDRELVSDFGTPAPEELIPIFKETMALECLEVLQEELDRAKANVGAFLEDE